VVSWLRVEPTRHQVAIAGSVTDAQTGKPIARAEVQIASRADCTQTAADGHFHFLDLSDGDYTLAVSLPGLGSRYGTAHVEVTVSHDGEGNIILTTADVVLPATTLRGQISELVSGDPVVMAQVRIEGSGERTYSDGEGRYLLSGLEEGRRKVMVSARGCGTATQTVELSRGDTTELDVALQKA
jgi:hypothetical protein